MKKTFISRYLLFIQKSDIDKISSSSSVELIAKRAVEVAAPKDKNTSVRITVRTTSIFYVLDVVTWSLIPTRLDKDVLKSLKKLYPEIVRVVKADRKPYSPAHWYKKDLREVASV